MAKLTTVGFSPEVKPVKDGIGSNLSLSPMPLNLAKGREKMYKIVTMEDTIRIPAEYMRKGQSLDQHIDRLSMTAFEGRFDDDNRFILVTNNHQPLGRGRIFL